MSDGRSALAIMDGPGSWFLRCARETALVLRHVTGREFGMARFVTALAGAIPSWAKVSVAGPDGERFRLNLRAGDFSVIMAGYRTKALDEIIARLPHEITVLDIGANIGAWTRVLGARFRRVIAFEPSPDNFATLSENCANRPNIECVQAALSDFTGSVTFSVTGSNSMHHISPWGGIEVACYRLDDLIREKVDLIKVDVEGFEEEVLAGAASLIDNYRPAILFEFIPWLAEERSRFKGAQLFRMLADRGYIIRRVDEGGHLSEDMMMDAQHGWTNDYMALIPGSEFEANIAALIK